MPKKTSRDEYLSKRRGAIGKTSAGREAVFKGFVAPPSYDPEKRSADFVMSSEAIDRDGDIVRQKGLDVSRFKDNPQALLFHNSRSWPVGQWSGLKKAKLDNGTPCTEGTLGFLPAGGPVPDVDQAHWMVQHGALRTVSIGFMPLDLELVDHDENSGAPFDWGFDILASELFECSLVPVPAQPDALVKGMLGKGDLCVAKEFIEQALDEWARDPRTQMLVPKKRLAGIYRKHFGDRAFAYMAADSLQKDAGKTALVKLMGAIEDAKGFAKDGTGIRVIGPDGQPLTAEDPDDDADDDDAEVEAISGIEIEFPITVNLTVTQSGTTGAVTRTGNDTGDNVTGGDAAAGASAAPAQARAAADGLLARAITGLKAVFAGSPATEPAVRTESTDDARQKRLDAVEAAYHRSERLALAEQRAAAIETRIRFAEAA